MLDTEIIIYYNWCRCYSNPFIAICIKKYCYKPDDDKKKKIR